MIFVDLGEDCKMRKKAVNFVYDLRYLPYLEKLNIKLFYLTCTKKRK